MDLLAAKQVALIKLAEEKDVSVKELMRAKAHLNDVPSPARWKDRLRQPENFAYHSKVQTTIRPDIDDEKEMVDYLVTAYGMGRRNQFLNATKMYGDIPSKHLQDETSDEYVARRKGSIKSAVKERERAQRVGNIINAIMAAGGASMGAYAGGGRGALVGGAGGAIMGAIPNIVARIVGEGKVNKKYLASLKPHERAILKQYLDRDAAELSQDASRAHRLEGVNYM